MFFCNLLVYFLNIIYLKCNLVLVIVVIYYLSTYFQLVTRFLSLSIPFIKHFQHLIIIIIICFFC